MSLTLIIILIGGLVAVGVGAMIFLLVNASGNADQSKRKAAVNTNLRALVMAQRKQQDLGAGGSEKRVKSANLALAAAAESEISRKSSSGTSEVTLEKRLKYAKWPITPLQFRIFQFFVTILLVTPAWLHFGWPIRILAILLGPQVAMGILNRFVDRRFKEFDKDYPVLLLQYVSLLKTGMSTLSGLEAAGKGLEEGSLVRAEVDLLVERLRLGLTEEQALSAFGSDIHHPELELFVQSLILSRRVGGTLSQTLERLARQVRKRQQFRQQAEAAVGMERSSIYIIACVMGALLTYLTFQAPELIIPALSHPIGRVIFEGGVALIIFGFWWSKVVTKIKI